MASLRSALVASYLSDAHRDAWRLEARLVRGPRRALTYVHEVDDPYGLLLIQVLPRLVEAIGADLRVLVIPTPSPTFVPDGERLHGWAALDAARLAKQHGLAFPESPRRPSVDAIARAQQLALEPGPWPDQLARLQRVSAALLAGEQVDERVDAGLTAHAAAVQLRANQGEVHRLGHYQGGMLHYEGEWYWGLDRVGFLEQRLREEGCELGPILDPEVRPHVDLDLEPAAPGLELELFYSLRSPYSYLALDRTRALAERHGVPLRIRPVLPMAMRGMSVPWAKRRYIAWDCKRIAASLGIEFGRIADPIGVGVERCLAVVPIAEEAGLLGAWLASVATGVWAEGVDVAGDRGLRRLAERAGLDGKLALAAARGELGRDWRTQVEANRVALLELGLWGVPSFRLGERVVWGQDRLDVLEAALQARGG